MSKFKLSLPTKPKESYKYPEFADAILKLSPPQFFGVCKILKGEIYTDQKDEQDHQIARDAYEIINDVLLAFEKLNRTQRRNLVKIVKKAAR